MPAGGAYAAVQSFAMGGAALGCAPLVVGVAVGAGAGVRSLCQPLSSGSTSRSDVCTAVRWLSGLSTCQRCLRTDSVLPCCGKSLLTASGAQTVTSTPSCEQHAARVSESRMP